MLLFAGSASAQWTIEYQREMPTSFQGIAFPSASVGYIVGSGGTIMKTTDGGGTWVQQTSPVPDSFFDVFFVDELEGWIVGDNGVMVYTTDGGANWYEHSQSGVLTTADLNTVYFVDGYGWTGGDSEDIFRTTDGGTTWYLAEALGSASEVEGISFADTLVGYAAVDGDGIIYSTDGGLNWTAASVNLGPFPYPSRTDIEEIFTIDDTTAVATGWGSMVGYQPTIIVVSYDAGVTWSCPDVTYGWDSYAYGYGIDKFDDGELIIVGGGSGFAGLNIHASPDLSTWTRQVEFFGDDLRDCAVIPGTNTVMAVGDEGCIATSTDRGLTWSFNYDPSFGFAGVSRFCKAGTTTLAVGTNGMFMKKDAGSDWTIPRLVSTTGYAPNFKDIKYIDGTIYVSAGYDYLARSDDMGATWTELTTPTSLADGMYGMHWFDVNNGVLVGERAGEDVIYLTDDGGQTRNEIWWNVHSAQFNYVHFAHNVPTYGVICGDEESVADELAFFYTRDGGATWTMAYDTIPPTTSDYEKCFMVDDQVAWAVGDNGKIAKSTDGGESWYEQPSWTSTVELNDVHFYPLNGLGWICGNDQTARQTNDGGVTWWDMGPTLEGVGDDINAIYLNDETNKLYIGCDQTMIQYWDNSPTDSDTPISLPFALNQNYPNPFNPSTTISFTLSRDGFVSLNVYDVAGRPVAKVLNRHMTAGSHEVGFNASGLASGVYFYKLKTDEQEMTRKMILLR
jgi:photosystem II stability/assembly factor-like uncharacterized protein